MFRKGDKVRTLTEADGITSVPVGSEGVVVDVVSPDWIRVEFPKTGRHFFYCEEQLERYTQDPIDIVGRDSAGIIGAW